MLLYYSIENERNEERFSKNADNVKSRSSIQEQSKLLLVHVHTQYLSSSRQPGINEHVKQRQRHL